MSAQPSQESAALTSALNAPVCAYCGRRRPTSGAGECCDGIGLTAASTTTFAPSLAAPLSKGSAASPGVNAPGRRQEDDVNLVALTSLQADSRAKTSPSPESDEDSLASAQDSSLSSPGSQMSFDQIGSSLRTSLGSSPLPTDETWESFSQRWPKSGMASVGGFSTLNTSEYPSGAVEFSLSDVLEMTVSERYALSARAAKGILRRAAVRGRTLPPELDKALRDLSA
jgi:hypothetical protein